MATEMVRIRSVKQYWNDIIWEGFKNGLKKDAIKSNLLDEFRREIFGQVAFKLGPEAATMSRDELANLDGIQNILHNSFRKWRRLCIVCTDAGIRGFIQLEDLKDALLDKENQGTDAHVLEEGEEVGQASKAV